MLKKILCADDLTQNAHKVVEVALSLTRCYGAELTILNVQKGFLDKAEMVMLRVDVSNFLEDMKEMALVIRAKIEDDVRSLGGLDLKPQIIIREGKPNKIITEVAEQLDVDLIVVGSHDASSLREILFGATFEEIIMHARRNVLSVWTGD